MGMYHKKTEPVEAYKWLGPEIPNEKQFPPTFRPTIDEGWRDRWGEYWLETIAGESRIKIGDYIIKDRNGNYERVRADEFSRLYTPVVNS